MAPVVFLYIQTSARVDRVKVEINIVLEVRNHRTAIPLYSRQEGLSEESFKRKHGTKGDANVGPG